MAGPGVDVSSTFPGLSPSSFGGGGGGYVYGQDVTRCAGGVGGGGDGAFQNYPASPQLAKAGGTNTGGGGGGGYAVSGGAVEGAPGGSGVVVVQFTPPAAPASTGPATATTPAPTVTVRATLLSPRTALATGQATKLAIRASNTGTIAAPGVTSCVTVPANLVITRTGGGTRTGRTVCFSVGDLAAGASATKAVTVRAIALRKVSRQATGSVNATGLASAAAADPISLSIRPRAARRVVVVTG